MPFFNFKTSRSKKPSNKGRVPLLSNQDPDPSLVEAFRTLLSNIRHCNPGKPLKNLLITSTGPQEGKSTIVANLGIILAQEESNILLVDADLRAPKQSEIFKVSKSPGLTELLFRVSSEQISKGNLRDFSVADAFQLLRIQRKNGIFTLEQEDMGVSFFFKNGELIETHWKNLDTKKNFDEILRIKKGTFHFQESSSLHELNDITNNAEPGDIFQRNIPQLYRQPFLDKSTSSFLKPTHIKNLKLLTSGRLPPNPPLLLGSENMKVVINTLQNRFDAIIFDTPPAGILSDAFALTALVDAVILVVRKGYYDKHLIQQTKNKLEKITPNIHGVILNQAEAKNDGNYYGYYGSHYKE